MSGYLRPVEPVNGRMSTFSAHKRRVPPSQEAGVDYYCPIGTPVRAAAAGRVFAVAGSILPATGRYVTLDLDDGRRVRYLHLKEWRVRVGDRVARGQIVGLSGASGYGSEFFGADSLSRIPSNTGGPHVHATLWPTHAYSYGINARTLDLEQHIGAGSTAGDGSTPFNPGEEDMPLDDNDKKWLNGLGQSVIDALRPRIDRLDSGSPQSLAQIRADIGHIHQESPFSLKAIRLGQSAQTIDLDALAARIIDGIKGSLPTTVEFDSASFAADIEQRVRAAILASVEPIADAAADEEDRRDRQRLGSGS